MFVGETGNLYIERGSPSYAYVSDFLVSCCEPVSRTQHMEEYRLDSSSLSAASAEGTYTCDMIRNILQCFRVDAATGQPPVDLERLAKLESWAASKEAEDDCTSWRVGFLVGAAEGEETGGAAPTHRPSVKSEDATTTPLHAVLTSQRPLSADTMGGEGGSRRLGRTLLLRRPRTSVLPAAGEERPLPGGPALTPQQPLASLAVSAAGDWVAPALPPAVERALLEEDGSSKMRIVLQPRLRRFVHGAGHRPLAGGASEAGDGAELFYFLVTADRQQLDRVVSSSAREFLEPIVLHGSLRWVASDVDHGMEETQLAVETGRPAVLRRLYASGACATTDSEGQALPGCELQTSTRAAAGARRAGKALSRVSRLVYKTLVRRGKLRNLKERLFHELGIRADCFYDYPQDPTLHVDQLSLASHVRLRPYQTASLERFHRGQKAHQGVVVLPCGAGKTLTGIGAAALLQKRTIVMCINNMSVFQWQREFLRWTNLSEKDVTVCTAKEKAMPGKVFITTYSMLIAKRGQAAGAAAQASEEILRAVRSQTWGLLLLDEVHAALAHHFQEVLNQLQYKCVLGLSATLLREDDRIADLRHLVGPKLYEANWLDLTRAGYLARVECAEVQCPMPAAFLSQYSAGMDGADATRQGASARGARRARAVDGGDGGSSSSDSDSDDEANGNGPPGGRRHRRRRGGVNSLAHNMAASNPYKLWCTQALLAFHQNRSPPDKVIIFCDYLADVRFYAYHLHLPFMDQRTSEAERANLLRYFQLSDTVNAIILTRVGDVALDLPCASVIIQVSGLGASRRQEAQRLGRILRPKPPSLDNVCSYFYTLVSQDTHEVRTSYERQSWLRDQGFAYRVLRSDAVLSEFHRVGGVPCCIGPPQWWYEARDSPAAEGSARGQRQSQRGVTPVLHDGHYWVPFSPAASQRMHYFFVRGKSECALAGDAHLGNATPRPPAAELGGVSVGDVEGWTVQFSSADAPVTFGTVTIGEAPLPSAAAAASGRVRRITHGQFTSPHDCLTEDGPCVRFALAGLGATVDDDTRDSDALA